MKDFQLACFPLDILIIKRIVLQPRRIWNLVTLTCNLECSWSGHKLSAKATKVSPPPFQNAATTVSPLSVVDTKHQKNKKHFLVLETNLSCNARSNVVSLSEFWTYAFLRLCSRLLSKTSPLHECTTNTCKYNTY